MKFYRITDEAETWWIEYRVSGMQNSIREKITNIKTSNSDPLELSAAMYNAGLPVHLGDEVLEVELTALCTTKELRISKLYEREAESFLRKSSAKEILTFTVPTQVGPTVITNGTSGAIAINVENDTVLTAIIPTFTVTNRSYVSCPDDNIDVVESGVTELDFSDALLLKVWDEALTDYDVDVTLTKLSKTAQITGFTVPGQTGDSTIDQNAGTIAITVPFAIDVTNLVPTITKSAGSTISPLAVATDFSDPVVFTVISEDLTVEKAYTVTITVADNIETDILTFSLAEQTGAAVVNTTNHTVAIEVANGTVVTALVATFTLSEQATAAVGATPQVTAVTANDFTNPVVYVVTAGDGTTTQNWTVTVTVAA